MSNELKNEKKELIKNFKILIEDLLDNYEKYTKGEKYEKQLYKIADHYSCGRSDTRYSILLLYRYRKRTDD